MLTLRECDMAQAPVNNEVYRRKGHAWWDESEGMFATIRYFVNPVRFGYFSRVLAGFAAHTMLDVGCGGGILSEEFARAGYRVTGIDPAPESIWAAREHALASGLEIDYRTGVGEELPFSDALFDIVVCCDVLEHVDDVPRVIGEIARVLRPGGIFFYDTINRTLASKIAVIKVMQEWRTTAFAEPNCHVWNRFIKPEELCAMLTRHGFENREMRGISTRANPIANWLDFRRGARGRITYTEVGQRMRFHESADLHVSYMGYAIRLGER